MEGWKTADMALSACNRFHGESVPELRAAFEEAVDDYLETCEWLNRKPQESYSGKSMLRIPAEIHAAVAMAAGVSSKSINQWATEKFAEACSCENRLVTSQNQA